MFDTDIPAGSSGQEMSPRIYLDELPPAGIMCGCYFWLEWTFDKSQLSESPLVLGQKDTGYWLQNIADTSRTVKSKGDLLSTKMSAKLCMQDDDRPVHMKLLCYCEQISCLNVQSLLPSLCGRKNSATCVFMVVKNENTASWLEAYSSWFAHRSAYFAVIMAWWTETMVDNINCSLSLWWPDSIVSKPTPGCTDRRSSFPS